MVSIKPPPDNVVAMGAGGTEDTLWRLNLFKDIKMEQIKKEQAGMSCAQPQAEAVSLRRKKASFFLKIYIRPVVAELFPLSLGSKFR